MECKEQACRITTIFDKGMLERIQEAISKATGLAFVTVDYKGEPVTKMTGFTDYCRKARENPEVAAVCRSSDAYGGIQGAVTRKCHIYFCPCGLMEIAIPIVVEGQYLGGFIGGQIQCADAPEGVFSLENLKSADFPAVSAEVAALRSQIPVMRYAQCKAIAEMVEEIVTRMCEERVRLIEKDRQCMEAEKRIEQQFRQLEAYKKNDVPREPELEARLNMHFLFNTLTSAANLSILEGAVKTNEIITLMSEFLRGSLFHNKGFWSVEKEINIVECYLQIQTVRFGERVRYKIDVSRNLLGEWIPQMILMPFVEYALVSGITCQRNGGHLSIRIFLDEGHLNFLIEDDGQRDMTDKEKIVPTEETDNHYSLEGNITAVKERLSQIYGTGYHVVEDTEGGKNRCLIWIPEKKAEHV